MYVCGWGVVAPFVACFSGAKESPSHNFAMSFPSNKRKNRYYFTGVELILNSGVLSFKLNSSYPEGSICPLAELNEVAGHLMEVRSLGILCSFLSLSSKCASSYSSHFREGMEALTRHFSNKYTSQCTFVNIKSKVLSMPIK